MQLLYRKALHDQLHDSICALLNCSLHLFILVHRFQCYCIETMYSQRNNFSTTSIGTMRQLAIMPSLGMNHDMYITTDKFIVGCFKSSQGLKSNQKVFLSCEDIEGLLHTYDPKVIDSVQWVREYPLLYSHCMIQLLYIAL